MIGTARRLIYGVGIRPKPGSIWFSPTLHQMSGLKGWNVGMPDSAAPTGDGWKPAWGLTEDERRYLAMHARYASGHQEDVRYWNPDPVERERLRLRWREIADALHPDPYGAGS